MDRKAIVALLVGMFVTFIGTEILDIFQAGTDAKVEATIKKVLSEELAVSVNGETKSVSDVLSKMSTDMALLERNQEVLAEALSAMAED